jgi:hypothetical protein
VKQTLGQIEQKKEKERRIVWMFERRLKGNAKLEVTMEEKRERERERKRDRGRVRK